MIRMIFTNLMTRLPFAPWAMSKIHMIFRSHISIQGGTLSKKGQSILFINQKTFSLVILPLYFLSKSTTSYTPSTLNINASCTLQVIYNRNKKLFYLCLFCFISLPLILNINFILYLLDLILDLFVSEPKDISPPNVE